MKNWNDEELSVLSSHAKKRNGFADALFYDITKLTASERSLLTPLIEREGSIVVVSPTQTDPLDQYIRHYDTADQFLESKDRLVKAIVLAGVGSSVLGAAALARNVANVYQIDVAGVVTGNGMADVMAEAAGGWFFYGAVDQARLEFQKFLEQYPQAKWLLKIAQSATSGIWNKLPLFVPPGDPDVVTLLKILKAQTENLRLLLGHSKGSLIINYVLERLVSEKAGHDHGHACLEKLQVVTLGTVSDLPGTCRKRQFIGDLDWFGGMNSRTGVMRTLVPNAWHHTNTKLLYHLAVEEVLKEVPLL